MTKQGADSHVTFGVSFSPIVCDSNGTGWRESLQATLDLGFKRIRIMSYWSRYETEQGNPDFSELDEIIKIIAKNGANITFCLGIKQPRWPESHRPEWAKELKGEHLAEAYLSYQDKVLSRYVNNKTIESWQLENEFWLKGFGVDNEYSRQRLIAEYDQLKKFDNQRPVIMSLCNSFGFPFGRPRPDVYGTSVYLVSYNGKKQEYVKAWYNSFYMKLRAKTIKLLTGKPLIIHELQAEPWGPRGNEELTQAEQNKSMSAAGIKRAVEFALATDMKHVDLWGAEWWYWYTKKYNDTSMNDYLSTILQNNGSQND